MYTPPTYPLHIMYTIYQSKNGCNLYLCKSTLKMICIAWQECPLSTDSKHSNQQDMKDVLHIKAQLNCGMQCFHGTHKLVVSTFSEVFFAIVGDNCEIFLRNLRTIWSQQFSMFQSNINFKHRKHRNLYVNRTMYRTICTRSQL